MNRRSTVARGRCRRAALASASGIALVSAGALPALAQDDLPSREEMWRIIQQQNQLIEEQRRSNEALNQRLDALEQKQTSSTSAPVASTFSSVEASTEATAARGWWDRTSIGGYGELHYEGGDKQEVDFHRFVLFIGHEFTEDIRLFTEVEIEHSLAGDGAPGEVELEQAYVQFDITNELQANAGLQLIPVGILNEVHEPPTFYGVERNIVENMIIPTTWWEAALGVHGTVPEAGVSYDLMLHSGLEVDDSFSIRGGRNKVATATAEDGAVTGRLKYTAIPGVELAASGQYQMDITQGDDAMLGFMDEAPAFLLSTHADARYGGFGLRALYAQWWINSDDAELIGRDLQYGWYIEPSYRFPLQVADWDLGEFGFFGRYSQVDTMAGNDLDTAIQRYTVGANWWPHPDVVFKMDWYHEDDDAGDDAQVFNVGFGYQF